MAHLPTTTVPDFAGTDADPFLHVVLVEPEIPPNTGTCARLCAATNTYLHLVKPLGFELENAKLKRAGLDYWPNVRLCVHDSFEDIEKIFPPERMRLFTTKVPKTYVQATYKGGDALIFGKETKGLSPDILQKYPDACVTIPIIKGHVRSLNLATSVSVGLYEALRQIAFSPLSDDNVAFSID